MVTSEETRKANGRSVEKRSAEELSTLGSELAALRRRLTGCTGSGSDEEFQGLLERFDDTRERMGVLEKHLKRERVTNRRKPRRKK